MTGSSAAPNALTYGLMFAGALIFYGALTAVWEAVGGEAPPIGVVALATLAVALALPALHLCAQRCANRLLFGDRAGAYGLASALVARMASTLAVDDVLPKLAETAARSVHGERGEVRLLLADGGEWRQVWPIAAHDPPVDAADDVRVAVQHRGRALGELGVDVATVRAADKAVLDELAAPAGLALSTVRLTFDLRRRVEELARLTADLDASRRRIGDAREVERRRLVAGVRARVAPHLEAAELALAAPQPAIDTAATELAAALEALRTVSRGIFPARLAESGLGAALEAWADRARAVVTVDVHGDPAILRRHPAVESTAYLACTVPFAGAEDDRRRHVAVAIGPDAVRVSASGVDDPHDIGTAIEALHDRLLALDGTLAVDTAGQLQAWLPMLTPNGSPR